MFSSKNKLLHSSKRQCAENQCVTWSELIRIIFTYCGSVVFWSIKQRLMSNPGWMNTTEGKARKYSDPPSSHNSFHEQRQNCRAEQRTSGSFLPGLSPLSPLQTYQFFFGQPRQHCHLSVVPQVPLLWQLPGVRVPPLGCADKNGCKMKSASAQLAWPFSHPLSSDWWDLNGLHFKSTARGELCPKRT